MKFYAARIRRILPAYLVMLSVVLIACYYLMVFGPGFSEFIASLKSAIYFNSAAYFAGFGGYFSSASHELPLQHTWTLAVEMQFYLLLPVAIALLPRKFLLYAVPAATLALFVLAERSLGDNNNQKVYFSLVARAPEFLIGSIVALFGFGASWSKKLRAAATIFGVFLIVVSYILIDEDTVFPGFFALIPCLGTAAILSSRGHGLSFLLQSAPLITIGNLSYSLYLWHWPVLALARYIYMDYLLPLEWLAVIILIVLALSYLSFKLVEEPVRKAPTLIAAFASSGVAVLMFMVLPFISSAQIHRVASKVPSDETPYFTDGGWGYRFMYEGACFGSSTGDCLFGKSLSEKPPILVIGDSQAAELAGFFDVVSTQLNFNYKIIASPDCATVPGLDKSLIRRGWDKTCLNRTQEVEKEIDGAEIIVISAAWDLFNPAALEQVREFVVQQSSRGKKVVIITQKPILRREPIRTAYFSAIGLPSWLRPKDAEPFEIRWVSANKLLFAHLSGIEGAEILDLTRLPIFTNAPYFDGKLIYFNKTHLNIFGSRTYGEQALVQFRSAIEK